jgi:hypothetical protein
VLPSSCDRQYLRLPHFEELEDEFELELDELFEFEFDDELDELLELEFDDELDELFELEFDDELDELLPARMIWPAVPVTVWVSVMSGLATFIACAAPAPRPKARAPVSITLRFMLFPFIKVVDEPDGASTAANGSPRRLFHQRLARANFRYQPSPASVLRRMRSRWALSSACSARTASCSTSAGPLSSTGVRAASARRKGMT